MKGCSEPACQYRGGEIDGDGSSAVNQHCAEHKGERPFTGSPVLHCCPQSSLTLHNFRSIDRQQSEPIHTKKHWERKCGGQRRHNKERLSVNQAGHQPQTGARAHRGARRHRAGRHRRSEQRADQLASGHHAAADQLDAAGHRHHDDGADRTGQHRCWPGPGWQVSPSDSAGKSWSATSGQVWSFCSTRRSGDEDPLAPRICKLLAHRDIREIAGTRLDETVSGMHDLPLPRAFTKTRIPANPSSHVMICGFARHCQSTDLPQTASLNACETARLARRRAESLVAAAAIKRALWQKIAPLTPVTASSAASVKPAHAAGRSARRAKSS